MPLGTWDGKQTFDWAVHTHHNKALCVRVFSLRCVSWAQGGEILRIHCFAWNVCFSHKYLVHKMNYNGDIYTNQDGILSDPVDDLIKIMIYFNHFLLLNISYWYCFVFSFFYSASFNLAFHCHLWVTSSLEFSSIRRWLCFFLLHRAMKRRVCVDVKLRHTVLPRWWCSLYLIIIPLQITTIELWSGLQERKGEVENVG